MLRHHTTDLELSHSAKKRGAGDWQPAPHIEASFEVFAQLRRGGEGDGVEYLEPRRLGVGRGPIRDA